MRSLSFIDQARSLGSVVARNAAEQAQAQVEREAQVRRMQSGRRRANAKRTFNYDRIVAAMRPYRAYRWTELETASGLDPAKFKSALTVGITNGKIEKVLERNETLYSLPC